MLSRLAIAVALLLAVAGCNREPYSRSNSGFSSLDKKLFYDFRGDQPDMGAKLDSATTRNVLSAVFPSYLSAMRRPFSRVL